MHEDQCTYCNEAVIFGWVAEEGLCEMQEIYTAVAEIGLHRDLNNCIGICVPALMK